MVAFAGGRFRPPLISKGLRPRRESLGLCGPDGFRPPLISKGLRRVINLVAQPPAEFQATPDFKGIKTDRGVDAVNALGFRPPLISKGLRLHALGRLYIDARFRPPLISKGLRPLKHKTIPIGVVFQATPDFKGIKTEGGFAFTAPVFSFRPPLISKGLRRAVISCCLTLILLQATPDFKGIKTMARFPAWPPRRCSRPPLISKGLRLLGHVNSSHAFSFQATS